MVEIANLTAFRAQVERLLAELGKFKETSFDELEKKLEQALLLLAGHASVYPPRQVGSRYQRTRTLGRLWTRAHPQVTVGGHVLDARIGNATPYGPYVQDPDQQAWMHAGRWQTTDQVVGAHMGEVEHLVAQAGGEIVSRIADAV